MVKIGPKSVPTHFRTGERGIFNGAHLRGQKRDHVVLLNMGDGKVALGRESDQLDMNINAFEEVQKRRDLRVFELNDILSEKINPGLKRFFETAEWGFARINVEDLLENFLPVVYKQPTFDSLDVLSDIDFFPKK